MRRSAALVLAAAVIGAAACTSTDTPPEPPGAANSPTTTEPPGATAAPSEVPSIGATASTPDRDAVVSGAAAEVAHQLSTLLFEDAPAHVLVDDDVTLAASLAARLQLPALTSDDDGRFGIPLTVAQAATIAGEDTAAVAGDTAQQLEDGLLITAPPDDGRAIEERRIETETPPEDLPELRERTGSADAVVLISTDDRATADAALAVAHAAGAQATTTTVTDPRTDPAAIELLGQHPSAVLVGGGDSDRWAQLAAVARTGVQLPGGGQTIFDGKMYVALYGHPGATSLGVLGEQGPEASVERARAQAAEYESLTDLTVVPSFEVIATVASAEPGADGDYSNGPFLDRIRPHVEAAAEAGIYVVLDLQPGLTDFLTQAKELVPFLEQPHVGLALDPEWRLDPCPPKCRHLVEIGSVSAEEVTAVADWLDEFTADRNLPQKMLLLHQFRASMLRDREQIPTDYDHIAIAVQMDGQGPQPVKDASWDTITSYGPEGIFFGWKNFHDEDQPTLDAAGTMAKEPTPRFVSYQ